MYDRQDADIGECYFRHNSLDLNLDFIVMLMTMMMMKMYLPCRHPGQWPRAECQQKRDWTQGDLGVQTPLCDYNLLTRLVLRMNWPWPSVEGQKNHRYLQDWSVVWWNQTATTGRVTIWRLGEALIDSKNNTSRLHDDITMTQMIRKWRQNDVKTISGWRHNNTNILMNSKSRWTIL